MKTEKILKLSLWGKSYTVLTDEQEDDVYAAAQLITDFFSGKTDELEKNIQMFLSHKNLVLSMLNMALELVKTKKILQVYEKKCTTIVEKIQHCT